MGRRIETTFLKKIIQYKIQWEMKNMDTQFLTPTKTMIDVTKESSDTHKKPSKKKSLRNSWRRY
jgi:hypothetical protein